MTTFPGFSLAAAAGDTIALTLMVLVGALILGRVGTIPATRAATALTVGMAATSAAGSATLALAAFSGVRLGVLHSLAILTAAAAIITAVSPRSAARASSAARTAAVSAPAAAALSLLVRMQDTRMAFSDVTAFMASAGSFARGRSDLLIAEPTTFYSFPPGPKVVHAIAFLYDPAASGQVVYGGAGIRPLGLALLLAAAIIAGSAVRRLVADHTPRAAGRTLAFLAAAALLASGAAVSTAHLNGSHAPVAAAAVALAWLLLDITRDRTHGGRIVAAALLVAAIALHRWEAALIVPLLLLPAVPAMRNAAARSAVPRLWQTLGATIALWSAAALSSYRGALYTLGWAGDPRRSLTALAGLGLAIFVAGTLLRHLPQRWCDIAPALAGSAVMFAVVVYGVLAWDQLYASLRATAINLLPLSGPAAGGWRVSGAAFIACGVVVAVSRLRDRSEETALFSYPALLFLPAMLLAALLREGAYRVGLPDSLNRSWLHILPLLLVSVASAASTSIDRADSPSVVGSGARPSSGDCAA